VSNQQSAVSNQQSATIAKQSSIVNTCSEHQQQRDRNQTTQHDLQAIPGRSSTAHGLSNVVITMVTANRFQQPAHQRRQRLWKPRIQCNGITCSRRHESAIPRHDAGDTKTTSKSYTSNSRNDVTNQIRTEPTVDRRLLQLQHPA
jgi:hypothetical protein